MIEFKNVTKIYDGHAVPALENLDLTIEKGEFVFIMGDSGAGKTTLTKLLLREENRLREKCWWMEEIWESWAFFVCRIIGERLGLFFRIFDCFLG